MFERQIWIDDVLELAMIRIGVLPRISDHVMYKADTIIDIAVNRDVSAAGRDHFSQ